MGFKTIILDKGQGIARITLNRPEAMNALTLEMLNEIEIAQKEIMDDRDVRVVIVTGQGRALCSGADFGLISYLLEMGPKEIFQKLRYIQDVMTVFETMEKPVVAAINGYALGGGLDMVLACDFRIAAKGAMMGEQYVRAGLMPDVGGTQRLHRLVGLAKAKEMIFLGDMIDADEAERIGLVNRVVSPDALQAETRALALRLASAPKAGNTKKQRKNAANQRFIEFSPSRRNRKQTDISHMHPPAPITGKFSSIVRTTADAVKIDFAVTTPL